MSERPIQPDGMASAVVPSTASTPEMSGTPPTQPTLAPVQAAVPSLPPASQDADTTPSVTSIIPAPIQKGRKHRPDWQLPKNSVIRKKALAIVAMRANGMDDEEIAKQLGITRHSLRTYIYRANKSGYLVNRKTGTLLCDPHDRLEFDLAQKAVENLGEMLRSEEKLSRGEKSVKMEATLAIANGVLFKKFDQPKDASMPTNVLQINIQGQTSAIDVTAGGTPLYTDGELVGSDDEGD